MMGFLSGHRVANLSYCPRRVSWGEADEAGCHCAWRRGRGAAHTVLLTHLHSDHIGYLGEVATQSWLGGRKVPLDVYGPPAPLASERTTDAEGETFGTAGTEAVVKGFAEAYNSDAEFRIAQGNELVPTQAARMIGHDVARPGPEGAVTVYDRDGHKISAFLVNHDPVEPAYGYRIEYGGRAAVVSGDTARVSNMVRFSKGADVLVHDALSRELVGMLASALDASGNARAAIEKYCSVIDAAPSKDLKILGQRQGYGSRAQAETAMRGLSCKQLPG